MSAKENFNSLLKTQNELRRNQITYLKEFMSNPGRFSILIMGERGTGKSFWAKEISDYLNLEKSQWHNQFIEASCASFSSETAISELFGYAPGSFTGGLENGKLGLFLEAAGYQLVGNKPEKKKGGGVLFLDEIHHLDPTIIPKLLLALQTKSSGENKGKYEISRLGESNAYPCEIRVVFGTNLTIKELKTKIPLDFFDRISQLILKFPSLNETQEIFKEFEKVYERMDFINKIYKGGAPIPELIEFKEWLNCQTLSGNYRDLEKIAIIWSQLCMIHSDKLKDGQLFIFNKLLEYFSEITNEIIVSNNSIYDLNKNYKYYENKLKFDYASWALKSIERKGLMDNNKFGNTGYTLKQVKSWVKIPS